MYMQKMRSIGIIFAVCVISACASNPERPPVVKLVPIPPELTAPIAEPVLEGDTNKDLITWVDRLREALRLANKRLQSIGEIKP